MKNLKEAISREKKIRLMYYEKIENSILRETKFKLKLKGVSNG